MADKKTTKKKSVKKSSKKAPKKTTQKTRKTNKSKKFTTRETASDACLSLWKKSGKDLEKLMQTGIKPDLTQLNGYRFRGLNVGLGPKLIGIRKFIKCFYLKDYGYGQLLTGHNFIVKQNKPEEVYITLRNKKGQEKVQGYYLVEDAEKNSIWNQYPNAALLHYGRGNNKWWDPAGKLRDFLVQPYADNPDLLLGKAYFQLGPLKIKGGYFVLERLSEDKTLSEIY
ncbi:MAG: hypothetical protein D6767_06645 [Candidatus Hydrogenedentota bacterium]|nr:MAG: hypothetical protein D6767_06645 [Candidatus Hydrogenedentota bacterium]